MSEKEDAANERFLTLYMGREDADLRMGDMLETEFELWKSGQKEYARSPNIFSNFTRLAETLNMKPEEILLVYSMKHLDGIISWINGHKSQREDVRGRINDLRVYLAILYLMVEVYEGKK